MGSALTPAVPVTRPGTGQVQRNDALAVDEGVQHVAAERLELLAVDRGHAVASLAGLDVEDDPVDEGGHGGILPEKTEGGPSGPPSVHVCVRLGSRDDVDDAATTMGAELNGACGKCKTRKICRQPKFTFGLRMANRWSK